MGRPKTTDELIHLHMTLCHEARELMRRKNADYGDHSATVPDPFANFHGWGTTGIVVRMDDKLARLRTFAKKGELQVKDEGVRDTVLDLINYGVLLLGYLEKEGKQ